MQSQGCCALTQSGANGVWRIWEVEKEISVALTPSYPRAFAALRRKLEKARSASSFSSLPFRKALILGKLLDSAEGQKQNPQLQRAAVAAEVWGTIWGQSC